MVGLHIDVVLGLRDHQVILSLEGSLVGRRVETDIVSWVSRESLGFDLGSIQNTSTCNLRESVFSGAHSPFLRHMSHIRRWLSSVAMHIDVLDWVFLQEFEETTMWVDTAIGDSCRLESL